MQIILDLRGCNQALKRIVVAVAAIPVCWFYDISCKPECTHTTFVQIILDLNQARDKTMEVDPPWNSVT